MQQLAVAVAQTSQTSSSTQHRPPPPPSPPSAAKHVRFMVPGADGRDVVHHMDPISSSSIPSSEGGSDLVGSQRAVMDAAVAAVQRHETQVAAVAAVLSRVTRQRMQRLREGLAAADSETPRSRTAAWVVQQQQQQHVTTTSHQDMASPTPTVHAVSVSKAELLRRSVEINHITPPHAAPLARLDDSTPAAVDVAGCTVDPPKLARQMWQAQDTQTLQNAGSRRALRVMAVAAGREPELLPPPARAPLPPVPRLPPFPETFTPTATPMVVAHLISPRSGRAKRLYSASVAALTPATSAPHSTSTRKRRARVPLLQTTHARRSLDLSEHGKKRRLS